MKEGAAFQVYAADLYMHTICWTAKELGGFIRYLFKLLENGKYDELQEYFFIGQILKGSDYRKTIPLSIRKQVLAAGECLFCGNLDNLTIDHIKPYSKGGTHDLSNLQCLCSKCNRMKYDKYDGLV